MFYDYIETIIFNLRDHVQLISTQKVLRKFARTTRLKQKTIEIFGNFPSNSEAKFPNCEKSELPGNLSGNFLGTSPGTSLGTSLFTVEANFPGNFALHSRRELPGNFPGTSLFTVEANFQGTSQELRLILPNSELLEKT